MKKLKKYLSMLIALVMVLSLGFTAFAADEGGAGTATGSITIKNATKGYEYKAYKVFDATYSGTKVSYKTPAANASKLSADLFGWSTAADSDGNISVWVKDGVADSAVIEWTKTNYAAFGGTAIAGTFDDTNSTVTFKNLGFGYYYITSGLGSVVTIDSAVPAATVYDKNTASPANAVKTIIKVDEITVEKATSANAHVGSVVTFQIDAVTTNWIDKDTIRKAWEITDTPTNMQIDPDSIVVKFNGTELKKDTDYTASVANDKLTINVPMVDANGNSVYPANLGPAAGQIPIVVTYDATIVATAGDAPAKNEVPDSPPVKIYTYAFQVAKTDGKDPLPGAEFELWSAKGGTGTAAALTFIDNSDGTYTYSAAGTVTTLDMSKNTTIVVKGLDTAWDYTLKEITVPEGYNQAEDVAVAGSSLTKVTENTSTATTSADLFKVTVVNKAGVELPSTGGIGTTIFYVIGSLLVIGAGVLLVARRRMR